MLAAVVVELGIADRIPRIDVAHEGPNDLAEPRIGKTHHRDLGDARVAEEQLLDLARIDLNAVPTARWHIRQWQIMPPLRRSPTS